MKSRTKYLGIIALTLLTLAIASYAAGPGAVKRAGGVPDQFTADYVTKLLARTDYLAGRRSTAP